MEIDQNPDLVYTDKDGRRNYEYLSLGCDSLPVLKGRSPIQVYSDFMRNFRDGLCVMCSPRPWRYVRWQKSHRKFLQPGKERAGMSVYMIDFDSVSCESSVL